MKAALVSSCLSLDLGLFTTLARIATMIPPVKVLAASVALSVLNCLFW